MLKFYLKCQFINNSFTIYFIFLIIIIKIFYKLHDCQQFVNKIDDQVLRLEVYTAIYEVDLH